ncbi:MAG: HEPN domain-containing protein [Candidatus Edwardsbacteria bacterium]|nr:HEPN domain-containing protein [Candidatus Edwardsbacteria bacterium]
MSPAGAPHRAVLDTAAEKLRSAELLLAAGHWSDAVSRAYYCAYHAISAVLLTKGLAFSSHGQAIGAFNREFVKSGLFPADFGRKLVKMQSDREAGDYRTLSPIGREVAQGDIEDARMILEHCRNYVECS